FDFIAGRATLLHGVMIEGGWAKAEAVHKLAPTALRVVLRQGLKRQIRLMFQKLGYEVKALVRTRIGPLSLENLRPGEWRFLTAREVELLQKSGEAPRERGTATIRARKNGPSGAARAGNVDRE